MGTIPVLFLFMMTAVFCQAQQFQGKWSCTALDPSHLALTGEYGDVQLRLFRECMDRRKLPTNRVVPLWAKGFRFNISGTEAIASYRPQVVKLLKNNPRLKVESDDGVVPVSGTGYWLNPIGQARFPDDSGVECISLNADVAHYLFVNLARPLKEGEKIKIHLPAGEIVDFTYGESTPSLLFKINQVGYMPNAPKIAYIGAWLGTAGPMPLHDSLDGKPFTLRRASDKQLVFEGRLKARQKDPVTSNGTPFTGEEVLELDFSRFKEPGEYYLEVPGTGRSHSFAIGEDTMAQSFYIHARGLYHQRCGIAKERPYTNWVQPTCHMQCVRGNFPPDINHYNKGNNRPFGFINAERKSITVKHFQLIAQNVPAVPETLNAPGGWHDAGDWDRRPQHLGIVGDLAAVYLLKPGNFIDGQLNLPESGNGIPDILDEAIWGIEHLRLKQQKDGGVGTWTEATRHPAPRDGMASEDKLTYYHSCATRNSSLEYAAYAAELALALRRSGNKDAMEKYRDSARRAFDYAIKKENGKTRMFNYDGKSIFYHEEAELAPEYLVKAAFNLFQLYNEEKYQKAVLDAIPAAKACVGKRTWSWSPLFWIEMELFPFNYIEMEKLLDARRKEIVRIADHMLKQQEENYPIRIAWYAVDNAWVSTMGWGTFHPLRRARIFIVAHALTHDNAYLKAACIANDFNNGANPFGSSMTSGLGRIYPARFLDLNSYGDGIAEFVPGITPYRNTYRIPREAVRKAYGLFYQADKNQKFDGLAQSFVPEEGLDEDECAKAVGRILPIWRRWCNIEGRTVAASEYTVWETIGPAAAVTGYLLAAPRLPAKEWLERKPVDDIRKLPGYAPLP